MSIYILEFYIIFIIYCAEDITALQVKH